MKDSKWDFTFGVYKKQVREDGEIPHLYDHERCERNEMQSMRETFGYSGTAHFNPSEVFHL